MAKQEDPFDQYGDIQDGFDDDPGLENPPVTGLRDDGSTPVDDGPSGPPVRQDDDAGGQPPPGPASPPPGPPDLGEDDPGWDEELLAAEGFTPQQAEREFGDPETFDRAIRFRDRQLFQRGRDRGRGGNQGQPGSAAGRGPARPSPQPGLYGPAADPDSRGSEGVGRGREAEPSDRGGRDQPRKPQWEPKPFQPPEEWDEDTRAIIGAVNEHWQSQLQELRDNVGGQSASAERIQQLEQGVTQLLQERQQTQMREVQQQATEIDEMLSDLGEDWKDVFGSGSIQALNPNGPAATNRFAIARQAAVYNQLRQEQGLRPLPIKKAVEAALRNEFPDKYDQQVRREVTGRTQSRRRQFIRRPSARRGQGVSGEERAIQSANKWYDENLPGRSGSGPIHTGEPIDDGF